MPKFEQEQATPTYLNYYPEMDALGMFGCYQWSSVRSKHSVAEVTDGKGTVEYKEVFAVAQAEKEKLIVEFEAKKASNHVPMLSWLWKLIRGN